MAGSTRVKKKISLEPMLWSSLMYLLGLVFLFYYLYPRVKAYIESNQIAVPEVSLGPILAYFFGVVVVLGVVLFFIPVSKLKFVLRVLFAILYGWGMVIILGLALPAEAAIGLGAAVALWWLFLPLVWLQNILLLVTLVAVGAVFGTLVPPWTVVWILLAVSVYDIVAVVLGYMMWLAKKLSESDTLPAFILPKKARDWTLNLRGSSVRKLFEEESAERDFSLLGGGDIGFPLVFVASVFSAYGFSTALVVAGASLAGLIFAYLLQIFLLKGKPLPALPPICFLAVIGFLGVYFTSLH
ncbi:MAG: Presenilin-like rane protease, family [Chloroflexi bacterium]|nr:Presenilin-like rane protease, family [Chloroflexota bacterium]